MPMFVRRIDGEPGTRLFRRMAHGAVEHGSLYFLPGHVDDEALGTCGTQPWTAASPRPALPGSTGQGTLARSARHRAGHRSPGDVARRLPTP
jgi:hypothetical protein